MNPFSRKSFLQAQKLEVDRMLELAKGDPFMEPGLQSRAEEIEQELSLQAVDQIEPASVMLLFSGRPVMGSYGIDAEFASRAVSPFVAMTRTQYAAEQSRNPAGRASDKDSRLMITGLPRGSFGVELTQPPLDTLFARHTCDAAITRVMLIVEAAATSNELFEDQVEKVSPKVIPQLRAFLKAVSEDRASVRIVSGERDFVLENDKAYEAHDRVKSIDESTTSVSLEGIFRGATVDSGRFDFTTKTDEKIAGTVDEELSDDDVASMNQKTNRECIAFFNLTTFTLPGGRPRKRYALLRLQ